METQGNYLIVRDGKIYETRVTKSLFGFCKKKFITRVVKLQYVRYVYPDKFFEIVTQLQEFCGTLPSSVERNALTGVLFDEVVKHNGSL